jgi:general secretion pathway protein C
VLLERGGALESLQLPQQSGAVRLTPPPASTSANPTMDRVRQLVAQDPSVIADIIRPQPVIAQGKQRGFRVYPGRNAAAFNRLGLRPGDLVTAINGTPLDDPARGEEIFRTLGSAAAANITIMRNGRQNELTLDMASVTAEAEQLLGTQGLGGVDQQAQVPGAPQ